MHILCLLGLHKYTEIRKNPLGTAVLFDGTMLTRIAKCSRCKEEYMIP